MRVSKVEKLGKEKIDLIIDGAGLHGFVQSLLALDIGLTKEHAEIVAIAQMSKKGDYFLGDSIDRRQALLIAAERYGYSCPINNNYL